MTFHHYLPYFVIAFLYILIGCTDNMDLSEEYIKPIKASSIYFELDGESSQFITFSETFQKDDQLFHCFLNQANNSIYIYNLNNAALAEKIDIPREGPFAIRASGFYFDNTSLVIGSNFENKVSWFKNDSIIKVVNLSQSEPSSNPTRLWLSGNHQINRIGSSILFGGIPDNLRNKTSREIAHNIIKYTDDDEISELIKYPEVYFKEQDWSTYQSVPKYSIVNKNIIIDFPISDYIYFYSIDGKLNRSTLIKSKYIDNIEPPPLQGNEMKEAQHYFTSSDHYDGVLYDSINEVIHRFATHTVVKIIDGEEKKIPKKSLITFSLVNNCIQSEVDLPSGTNTASTILTKEGLYIQRLGKEIEEEIIVYDLYKLIEDTDSSRNNFEQLLTFFGGEILRNFNIIYVISNLSCPTCINDFLAKNIYFEKDDLVILIDCDSDNYLTKKIKSRLSSKVQIRESCDLSIFNNDLITSSPFVLNIKDNALQYLY